MDDTHGRFSRPSHLRAGAAWSGDRRAVDRFDRRVQRLIERGLVLLRTQPLGQRAAEAGDDAGVFRQQLVGLLARIAARQRNDLEARVFDQLLKNPSAGQGERASPASPDRWARRQQALLHLDLDGVCRRLDVDLRLDDRHIRGHTARHLDAGRHGGDAGRVVGLDDRALLGGTRPWPWRARRLQGASHQLHPSLSIGPCRS